MIAKTQSNQPQGAPPKSPLTGRDKVDAFGHPLTMTRAQIQKSNDDADAIRLKLEKLGITEADVADAIKWARANPVTDGA